MRYSTEDNKKYLKYKKRSMEVNPIEEKKEEDSINEVNGINGYMQGVPGNYDYLKADYGEYSGEPKKIERIGSINSNYREHDYITYSEKKKLQLQVSSVINMSGNKINNLRDLKKEIRKEKREKLGTHKVKLEFNYISLHVRLN